MVNSTDADADRADAFWRFSLDFYGRPGVAAACLALQDGHDRDVNLVLFACWVGISGRGRLTRAAFDAAEADIAPWRRSVTDPLRALRRRMTSEADAADLYGALKAAELAAERVAQNRLETKAPDRIESSAAGRVTDAIANLALYLGPGSAWASAEPLQTALQAG
jgi:uncharacterized protein (TIGR02444 family)